MLELRRNIRKSFDYPYIYIDDDLESKGVEVGIRMKNGYISPKEMEFSEMHAACIYLYSPLQQQHTI
jgi:hypothetical protein